MEKLEQQLADSLQRVTEWLKFAEAKNAALVAANAGLILASIHFGDTKHAWPVVAMIGVVSYAISLVTALASFSPTLAKPGLWPTADQASSDNLIFFGDIAKYDDETFLNAFCRGSDAKATASQVAQWTANQVVINSRIALRKFKLFNVALIVSGIGLAATVVCALKHLAG